MESNMKQFKMNKIVEKVLGEDVDSQQKILDFVENTFKKAGLKYKVVGKEAPKLKTMTASKQTYEFSASGEVVDTFEIKIWEYDDGDFDCSFSLSGKFLPRLFSYSAKSEKEAQDLLSKILPIVCKVVENSVEMHNHYTVLSRLA